MGVNKKRYNEHIDRDYVRIPNFLPTLKVDGLDVYAKMIWLYITSEGPSWDSSRNNIARNLGLAPETVSEKVKILQNLNMLVIKTGKGNSWNFEIMPTNEWAINCLGNDVTQTGQPDTNTVGGTVTHIQEEKEDNKSLARNFNSIKEEKSIPYTNLLPVNQGQQAAPTLTFMNIVNSWVSSVDKPLDHLSHKNMESTLSSIVATCKVNGLTREEINPSKFSKIFFDKLPRKSSTQKWQGDIEQLFAQLADAQYFNVKIEQAVPGLTKTPVKVVEDVEFNRFAHVMAKAKGAINV